MCVAYAAGARNLVLFVGRGINQPRWMSRERSARLLFAAFSPRAAANNHRERPSRTTQTWLISSHISISPCSNPAESSRAR